MVEYKMDQLEQDKQEILLNRKKMKNEPVGGNGWKGTGFLIIMNYCDEILCIRLNDIIWRWI